MNFSEEIKEIKEIKKTEEKETNIIMFFFNTCDISCSSITDINGIIIPREKLLSLDLYDKVKTEIPKLKSILSSSIFTSVHKNASQIQKWPLLNLIRQILRKYNYELIPKRICDGYTKDGIKKYKRFFEIKLQ